MAAGGRGLVAVGVVDCGSDSDAAAWVSSDGNSWTRIGEGRSMFDEPGQYMASVVAGGPGVVAVGYDYGSGDAADGAV